MSDQNNEGVPRPLHFEIIIRHGILADAVASTNTFFGSESQSREANYEEGMRVLNFLRGALDSWEKEIEDEYGPERKDG